MSVMAGHATAPGARCALRSVLIVAALPTATPCARLHARSIACEWGLGELADTIELVVSELVTTRSEPPSTTTADRAIPLNTAWPASTSGSQPMGWPRSWKSGTRTPGCPNLPRARRR
jgi:hypothetical protein